MSTQNGDLPEAGSTLAGSITTLLLLGLYLPSCQGLRVAAAIQVQ